MSATCHKQRCRAGKAWHQEHAASPTPTHQCALCNPLRAACKEKEGWSGTRMWVLQQKELAPSTLASRLATSSTAVVAAPR